jgi:hypothetical protein
MQVLRAGSMAQVAECFPSKHKALGLSLGITKKKKKKKKMKSNQFLVPAIDGDDSNN